MKPPITIWYGTWLDHNGDKCYLYFVDGKIMRPGKTLEAVPARLEVFEEHWLRKHPGNHVRRFSLLDMMTYETIPGFSKNTHLDGLKSLQTHLCQNPNMLIKYGPGLAATQARQFEAPPSHLRMRGSTARQTTKITTGTAKEAK